MDWFKKIFIKNNTKVQNADNLIDDLIWDKKTNIPKYDYANRHFEPEWMLQIRQEESKKQMIKIIEETPESELLLANYNNETFLSLLIEKDESYIPVIKALIEKYPQILDQQFKVKHLKSYIEYSLEKHNLPAYQYLISQAGILRFRDSQYENYLNQLTRFTKENENILSDGLDKIENIQEIPWNTMKTIFLTQKNGQTQYVFGRAQKKSLLLLLNKNYFGDSLKEKLGFFVNLFDINSSSIMGEDTESANIVLKLYQLQCIPSVNFVEDTLQYPLSFFHETLYISKVAKSLKDLGIVNKSLVKAVYSKIFRKQGKIVKINEPLVNCLVMLNKINPQLLVPLVNSWEDGSQFVDIIKSKIRGRDWSVVALLEIYSQRRVVQLFINEIKKPSVQEIEFQDTLIQSITLINLCKEFSFNPKDYFTEKPQSFHQIHETLWREISKLKNQNIKLHSFYPPEIISLNGKTLEDFTIEIPEDSHRLIEVGQYMSICVGGGNYRDKIVNQTSFIILLLREGKLEFCIEVANGRIIQFKGHKNQNGSTHPIYHLFKDLIF